MEKYHVFTKMECTRQKSVNSVFSFPTGRLDEKEPFYAHFKNFGPFWVEWERWDQYATPPFAIFFQKVLTGPRGSKIFFAKMFLIEG